MHVLSGSNTPADHEPSMSERIQINFGFPAIYKKYFSKNMLLDPHRQGLRFLKLRFCISSLCPEVTEHVLLCFTSRLVTGSPRTRVRSAAAAPPWIPKLVWKPWNVLPSSAIPSARRYLKMAPCTCDARCITADWCEGSTCVVSLE